jgi:hypothetical protein
MAIENLENFVKKEVDFFLKCAEKLKNGEMSYGERIEGSYNGIILYNGDLKFLEKMRQRMQNYLEEKDEDYLVVCSPSIDRKRMIDIGFYCINVRELS